MSSRNLRMLRWAEGHRRSPRISALDSCKARKTRQDYMGGGSEGPSPSAFRTRRGGRTKRKLQAIEDTEDEESDEPPSQEDHPSDSDQPDERSKYEENYPGTGQRPIVPFETRLPEKHVLKLVLDVLQRRDTYEIFAEPVDPSKVVDYYEIIEEPMDFGTMRAKLHKGMYETLQQFEHDAFLITKNAMHFNSSTTIYFRQARGIHELAKKVFNLLETDPEGFELQFSETRRRSTRKLTKPENGRSKFSNTSFCRTTLNSRSGHAIEHESPKSVHIGSTLGEASNGRSQSDAYVSHRICYGYKSPLHDKSSSTFTAVSDNMEPLMLVNQQEMSYTGSLMSFAKDLGPTARKVAQRKLLELGMSNDVPYLGMPNLQFSSLAPKPQAREVPNSIWLGSHHKFDTVRAPSKPQNLTDHPHRRPVVLGCTSSRLHSSFSEARKKATPVNQSSSLSRHFVPVSLEDIGQPSNQAHIRVVHANGMARNQPHSPSFDTKTNVWTPHTTSEIHHTDSFNTGKNLPNFLLQRNTGSLQNMILVKSHRDSLLTGPSLLAPPASQFTFDLPYLKMRLDQMKSVDHQESLPYNSGLGISTDLFMDENIYQKYTDFGAYSTTKQQGSFDDDWFGDLALQL